MLEYWFPVWLSRLCREQAVRRSKFRLRFVRKPMKSRIVLLACLAFAGCVPSWDPFYTEKDLTFEPALVGTWHPVESKEGSSESWAFTKAGEKLYELSQTDEDGYKATFNARL